MPLAGKELRSFTGHTGSVVGVAYTPDGSRFAGENYVRNSVKVVIDAYDGTQGWKITPFGGRAKLPRTGWMLP